MAKNLKKMSADQDLLAGGHPGRITGPGTAFEHGRFDGLAGDTIIFVEVRSSGIHWMENSLTK